MTEPPMTGPLEHDAEWDEVEALVRAAGGYVRPSEDLRPRLLETARAESRERQAHWRIWQLALAIALLAAVATVFGARPGTAASFSQGALRVQAEVRPAEGGAPGWRIVDSFTDLRRRQAALLRPGK